MRPASLPSHGKRSFFCRRIRPASRERFLDAVDAVMRPVLHLDPVLAPPGAVNRDHTGTAQIPAPNGDIQQFLLAKAALVHHVSRGVLADGKHRRCRRDTSHPAHP